MSDVNPTVSRGRKFAAVWIVPLVAVVLGVWMVAYTFWTEGPTITVEFKTAEGLEVGKTKVRILNLEIGIVEDLVLSDDLSGVQASIKLDRKARSLLRDDTEFWVVRALSGAYIEMAPGSALKDRRAFIALEAPPLTPLGAPGLRVSLFSDQAGSLSSGNPVLYNGYEVGRVESSEFDLSRQQIRYDIFIDSPYNELVNSSTRFWNVSGISVNAAATGLEVSMSSVETLLLGGVAFGTPPGAPAGLPVKPQAEFQLYGSLSQSLQYPYQYGAYYVVSFTQSLRGLVPGAPVEFRGIPVGRVERILLKEITTAGLSTGEDLPIPVLIYLEPGRLEIPDTEESVGLLRADIERAVRTGIRATLTTGNLLTGSQLVSLDFFPSAAKAELGQFDQYPEIPTIESGLDNLQTQLSDLLAKLNALPLDETVGGANAALVSLKTGLDSVGTILASDGAQSLPAEVVAVLVELRSVLDGVSQDSEIYQSLDAALKSLELTLDDLKGATQELSERPNAIIFPTKQEPDLIPGANQ